MCYDGHVPGKVTRRVVKYEEKMGRRLAGPRPEKCLVDGCDAWGIVYEIPVCARHYKKLSDTEKNTSALGYHPGKPMPESVRALVKGYLLG
jgi:hypothetical protein